MVILVRLFGILIVALGIIFLAVPDAMKKYIAFWAKGKRIYTGGILSIVIGIIFLLAASQCKLVWFVVVMGIWALIKGIVLLTLGPEKWLSYINWWTVRPPAALRVLSLVAIALGILLVYSA